MKTKLSWLDVHRSFVDNKDNQIYDCYGKSHFGSDIWKLGQCAYEFIVKHHFECNFGNDEFDELETFINDDLDEEFLPQIIDAVNSGVMNLSCQSTEQLKKYWKDYDVRDKTKIFMGLYEHAIPDWQADTELIHWFGSYLAVSVLRCIDESILSYYAEGNFLAENISDASLLGNKLESIEEEAKKVSRIKSKELRIRAHEAALAKLKLDPKQSEKKSIKECWELWRIHPDNYKSKAAFARDMLDKYEHVKSTVVIERWCREWERDTKQA